MENKVLIMGFTHKHMSCVPIFCITDAKPLWMATTQASHSQPGPPLQQWRFPLSLLKEGWPSVTVSSGACHN